MKLKILRRLQRRFIIKNVLIRNQDHQEPNEVESEKFTNLILRIAKITGVGLLGAKERVCSVKAKIQKICSHYDRLKEIFSYKSEGGSSYAAYEIQVFLVCEDEQTDDVHGNEEIYSQRK